MKKKNTKNKRNSWLKVTNEFYEMGSFKKLRSIPAGGDTYAFIYARMLALTASAEGNYHYGGFGADVEEEIALILNEDVSAVNATVTMLRNMGRFRETEQGCFLPEAVEWITSRSEAAERVYRMRERRKLEIEGKAKQIPLLAAADADTTECNGSGIIGIIPNIPGNTIVTDENAHVTGSYGDVTKCNANVTGCNGKGIIGIVPNMPAGGQKVKDAKESSNDAAFEGIEAKKNEKNVTTLQKCYADVTPVDNSGIIGIIPDMPTAQVTTVTNGIREDVERNDTSNQDNTYNPSLGKPIKIHPSIHDTNSSLKSVVDTNCKSNARERSRAFNYEGDVKTEAFIPEDTSTRQESPVTDGEPTLDGGMDGLKNSNPPTSEEVNEAFETFWKEYPRPEGKRSAVKKTFRELVYLYKVDPYDLVTAATKYTKWLLEVNRKENYVKMPQNFLSELTWQRYIPVYRKRCPLCHGEGMYEKKRDDGSTYMAFCDCRERYKDIPVLKE